MAKATFSQAKAPNKVALQTELGLEPDADALLFCVISRLTEQKGLDLLLAALPRLLARGAQLAVLGTDDRKLEKGIRRAAKKYAGLADAKLKTVPVNFLSDLDITGGNSGSPVLDAHGKLVGLAFDGNWESVASNWVFDPTMSRMISVDQRYMRWVMQEVMPAPQLLQEMGVAPKQ